MRLSTLRARDPSIIAWKAMNYSIGENSHSADIEEDNHLHVYLRIKDGIKNFEDLYQVSNSQIIVSKSAEEIHTNRDKKKATQKKYNFSKIFGPKTKQCEIFDELVKPKLLKFINGHNSTLLTYGVSSSGKTYTIVGTAEEPGVIPRSLQYMFRTLPELTEMPTFKPSPFGKIIRLTPNEVAAERILKENILNFHWSNNTKDELISTYRSMQSRLSDLPVAELEEDFSHLAISVWVSFAEIYNENIYDLLRTGKSQKEKLKLSSAHGETYVKNLSLIHVASGLEAYQILQYGLYNLNYAKTNINDHSSRSHSIFTIWLAQAVNVEEEKYHVSQFNFCDLAGAERCKKTLNVGQRLKESQNINTSLLVLGRCIAAVRKAQKSTDQQQIIPFRESKLTQLFQKALSGLEEICMIVNMNPCQELFEETQHVLNFSAIAKEIMVLEPPPIQPRMSEKFSELVRRSIHLGQMRNEMEKSNMIEHYADKLSEIENKISLEEMNQIKDIVAIRADIRSGYIKELENQDEEMQYDMMILERNLKQENTKRLKIAKREIIEEFDEITIDMSDAESESSCPSSNMETIYVASSSEDEDEGSEIMETIVISSDEEEGNKENEIDVWKRKVKEKDELLAEHHKTITHLIEQLKKLGEIEHEKHH